jgi:hypothetical protein
MNCKSFKYKACSNLDTPLSLVTTYIIIIIRNHSDLIFNPPRPPVLSLDKYFKDFITMARIGMVFIVAFLAMMQQVSAVWLAVLGPVLQCQVNHQCSRDTATVTQTTATLLGSVGSCTSAIRSAGNLPKAIVNSNIVTITELPKDCVDATKAWIDMSGTFYNTLLGKHEITSDNSVIVTLPAPAMTALNFYKRWVA